MLMFDGADPGEYISRRPRRQLIHVRLVSGWVSFRVVLLCCICCITFGTYWINDAPAALYTQFQGWFGEGFTNESNANLYAVYSYPNVILPFVCGVLVDRWLGIRWGTMLFRVAVHRRRVHLLHRRHHEGTTRGAHRPLRHRPGRGVAVGDAGHLHDQVSAAQPH